jgi:adenosylcobinamide-GDP ribazoletransferase
MSWRSRERMLEIMKDSRIGAMGALALVAVIALKLALLSASGAHWWIAAIFACTLGRWVDAYGIIAFPAAKEGGLGKNFHDAVRTSDFGWATASVLVLAGVLSALSGAPGPMAVRLGLTMLLSLAGAHAFAAGWVRTLGGLTGDTYGALSELIEVIALAAISAQAAV